MCVCVCCCENREIERTYSEDEDGLTLDMTLENLGMEGVEGKKQEVYFAQNVN